MKISKHYSVKHAEKVLQLVKRELKARAPEDAEFDLRHYANGREQGYLLETGNESKAMRAVAFAENRSSDHVVIYFGRWCDFNNAGQPNEVAYASRTLFTDDGKAARAIATFLLRGRTPTESARPTFYAVKAR